MGGELCQQPDRGISCVGCCLYEPVSSDDLGKIASRNTERLGAFMLSDPDDAQIADFFLGVRRTAEVCEAVVYLEDTTMGCGAHPSLWGADHREHVSFCYPEGRCAEARRFLWVAAEHREAKLVQLGAYSGRPEELAVQMHAAWSAGQTSEWMQKRPLRARADQILERAGPGLDGIRRAGRDPEYRALMEVL